MENRPPTLRDQLIQMARSRLEQVGEPRLMMTWIVLGAGLAAFLGSVAMLRLGLLSMSIRYPLAIGIGYLVFLWLLGFWLRNQTVVAATSVLAGAAAIEEVSDERSSLRHPPARPGQRNSGSRLFSGLWNGLGSSGSGSKSGSSGDGAAIVLVLIVIAVLGSCVVALILVLTSPALFAELLVDGVVLAGLPKRFHQIEKTHWLRTSLWKTWVPAACLACLFAFVGFGLESAALTPWVMR